jgi:hypothetical protein
MCLDVEREERAFNAQFGSEFEPVTFQWEYSDEVKNW